MLIVMLVNRAEHVEKITCRVLFRISREGCDAMQVILRTFAPEELHEGLVEIAVDDPNGIFEWQRSKTLTECAIDHNTNHGWGTVVHCWVFGVLESLVCSPTKPSIVA